MTEERRPVLDMIGQPLAKDDYVVSYNHIYQVIDPGRDISRTGRGSGIVTILLLDKSKTTRPMKKNSYEVCKIDRDAVMLHLLKKL